MIAHKEVLLCLNVMYCFKVLVIIVFISSNTQSDKRAGQTANTKNTQQFRNSYEMKLCTRTEYLAMRLFNPVAFAHQAELNFI